MATRRATARPARRKTVWARSTGVDLSVPVSGAGANLQDDLLVGAGSIETALGANAILGATVGRIRGVMSIVPGIFTTTAMARVGVKVDDAASAATNEGPYSAPYDDWMLFEPFVYDNGGGVVADLQDQSQVLSRVIDVKSMRRLSELNQTIWLYAESSSATVSWSFSYDLSILLLLP